MQKIIVKSMNAETRNSKLAVFTYPYMIHLLHNLMRFGRVNVIVASLRYYKGETERNRRVHAASLISLTVKC